MTLFPSSLAQWGKKATRFYPSQGLNPKSPAVLTAVLATLLSACAYRFTSEHTAPPAGVRTIAIEAIYDASREVIPRELLWESLQNAFAADGHIKLAPQSRADALLRAHIKEAGINSAGDNSFRFKDDNND